MPSHLHTFFMSFSLTFSTTGLQAEQPESKRQLAKEQEPRQGGHRVSDGQRPGEAVWDRPN